MNKDLKDTWVATLRSGKYEQGTGYLKQGNKFCCLGVLCDLVNPEGWRELNYDAFPRSTFNFNNFEDDTLLPLTLAELLRVTTAVEITDEDGVVKDLMTFNDYEKFSFNDIADIIEKYLPVTD